METNFESLFISRSPQFAHLMTRFKEAIGKSSIDFTDINAVNMRLFKSYMQSRVAANSMRTYFAVFKAFCRECYEDGMIANIKCLSSLDVHRTPQQNVSLTEEEVQKVYDYYINLCNSGKTDDETLKDKDVLVLFLIECYTGARGCDVEKFTRNNIQNDILSYVSQKTKTLSKMPVHKNLPMLIDRIPKTKYQRCSKNRTIKKVCKECHIDDPITIMYRGKYNTRPKYEYCATHTARRSYVSNLLDRGVPIALVSKMAGHSSVIMTQKYYCSDKFDFDDNAMAFFND